MKDIKISLNFLIKGLQDDIKTEKLFVSSRQSPDEYGASVIRRGLLEDLICRLKNREEDLVKE